MLAIEWYLVGAVVCSVVMLTLYGIGIVINRAVEFILEVWK
jgi:hypothetical protein